MPRLPVGLHRNRECSNEVVFKDHSQCHVSGACLCRILEHRMRNVGRRKKTPISRILVLVHRKNLDRIRDSRRVGFGLLHLAVAPGVGEGTGMIQKIPTAVDQAPLRNGVMVLCSGCG
jgi:hypothetical protein